MKALKVMLVITLAIMLGVHTYTYTYAESNKVLLTSYNPDYYLNITLNGDEIQVKGKLEGETAQEIYIFKRTWDTNVSYEKDNTFTATVDTSDVADGEHLLKIYLSSDNLLYYRLERVNGEWRFPNENLSAQVGASISGTDTMSEMVAASYLAYPADKENVENALDAIKSLSDDICKNAETDYDRAKAIFLWVTNNIYYDYDAKSGSVDLETIALANVVETKKTVCAGFANLYGALCLAQGIDSVTIKGAVVRSNERLEDLADLPRNHEWSAVKLDDRWAFVDCTWSTQNAYSGGEYVKGATSMKFFDITAQALSADHRIDIVERRNYFDSLSYFADNEQAVINPISPDKPDEKSNLLPTILVAVIAVTSLAILAVTMLLFKKNDRE